MRLGYQSDDDATVRITAGEERHEVELPAGSHAVYFSAKGDFESIALEGNGERARICVDELSLGIPFPTVEKS